MFKICSVSWNPQNVGIFGETSRILVPFDHPWGLFWLSQNTAMSPLPSLRLRRRWLVLLSMAGPLLAVARLYCCSPATAGLVLTCTSRDKYYVRDKPDHTHLLQHLKKQSTFLLCRKTYWINLDLITVLYKDKSQYIKTKIIINWWI